MSVAGPQRQKTQIELEIEFVKFAIGELMADSLCAFLRVAYGQHKNGVQAETSEESLIDLLSQLNSMLEHTAAHYFEHLDFNATARGYGKRALRERAAAPPVLLAASDDFVDMIVSGLLDVLARARKARAVRAGDAAARSTALVSKRPARQGREQMKKGDL